MDAQTSVVKIIHMIEMERQSENKSSNLNYYDKHLNIIILGPSF
jgi:hypothetical protein